MDFGLSDPQLLLHRTAAQFLKGSMPIDRVRQIMESPSGFDPDFLKELGDQGLLSLLIAEEHGGMGLGLLDTVVVAQALARANAPLNFHDQAVFSPLLLAACGGEIASTWLPRIAEGTARVAVADGPFEENDGKTTALYVPDATVADAFLVVRSDQVHFVTAENISSEPLLTVDDTRRLGDVTLTEFGHGFTLGFEAIDRARQAARIALAADALGASQQGLDIAVEYSLGREQFGRVIASYQGLKHVCAEVVAEIDPIQSLVWFAAFSWDKGDADSAWLAPLTKAHATDAGTSAVTQATQVFGGMGFTWECDMHLSYKRVGFDRQILGSPGALRREAADIQHPPR